MMSTPFAIGSTLWPGLSKVVEETGELLQVLGKVIATGGQMSHWDATDLRPRLQDEIADAYAALDFFLAVNVMLDRDEIEARRETKRRLFWKWHAEQ